MALFSGNVDKADEPTDRATCNKGVTPPSGDRHPTDHRLTSPGSSIVCCGLPTRAGGYDDAPVATSSPFDMEVSTVPTALVTGALDRVPDIVIALKSGGFDILAAGVMSPDAPDIEAGSVDCFVQVPVEAPPPQGGALRRTRALIAHELLARFDTAVRFLPLLAPGATVVLVAGGPDPDPDGGPSSADPEHRARRALAGVLAEAIARECGRLGVRAVVIGEDRAPDEIAALAGPAPA